MDLKTVSDADFATTKQALKIDFDDDKDLIESLVIACRLSIVGRVGNDLAFYDTQQEIFNMAVNIMVYDRYYYRGSVSDDEIFRVEDSLNMYILDLKSAFLVYEDGLTDSEESDTNDNA
ncbi:head-tail connector protein [Pediococcus inopinatus]|uniref:head-tail connector protein n=1 Tax=Pediococcus inopinatus TaxID=114090 RepID=UPI002B2645D6|nr:head-tail connector protein [Pediococcus inopinatus]WPC19425.1 head-tail connector protein [Pediococcus inopinatus]